MYNEIDSVNSEIVRRILERAKVGKEKYGVTMDREDLTFDEWAVHLQEELMDAIVYIEKLRKIIPERQ